MSSFASGHGSVASSILRRKCDRVEINAGFRIRHDLVYELQAESTVRLVVKTVFVGKNKIQTVPKRESTRDGVSRINI